MHTKIASTTADLRCVFSIRKKVFVEEQHVPLEEEIDLFENESTHVILFRNGKAIGTGRCRIIDDSMKIERICILKPFRKSGAGQFLMQKIEELAKKTEVTHFILHAQTQAIGFYTNLGYSITSSIFQDAGIPHVTMQKKTSYTPVI